MSISKLSLIFLVMIGCSKSDRSGVSSNESTDHSIPKHTCRVIDYTKAPSNLEGQEIIDWFLTNEHLVNREVLTPETAKPLYMTDGEFMYYIDDIYENESSQYHVFIMESGIFQASEFVIQKVDKNGKGSVVSATGSSDNVVALSDDTENLEIICAPNSLPTRQL